MDFVFWIILIVLIVGVVWWLLNRGSSTKSTSEDDRAAAAPAGFRADGALAGGSAAASAEAAGTTGIATAAGFGRPSDPVPPTTADDASELPEPSDAGRVGEQDSPAPERTEAGPGTTSAETIAAPAPTGAPGAGDMPEAPVPPAVDDATEVHGAQAAQGGGAAQSAGTAQASGPSQVSSDQGEWETQWSEAGGTPASHAAAPTTAAPTAPAAGSAAGGPTDAGKAGQSGPVHRPEYTGPHAPTLPGAESAAAEVVVDEPAAAEQAESNRVQASPGEANEVEAIKAESPTSVGSESVPEPAGYLAADRPYGEGSASPSPDGSGPADYTVKGDADSMVYYEEGHPEYEQTRAGVWFESAAHAEAAGFRAPRRTRFQ